MMKTGDRERHRTLRPERLHEYFSSLGPIQQCILQVQDGVKAAHADDWAKLPAEARDDLLSQPFVIDDFNDIVYNEDQFGMLLAAVRQHAIERTAHEQWKEDMLRRKQDKDKAQHGRLGKLFKHSPASRRRSSIQPNGLYNDDVLMPHDLMQSLSHSPGRSTLAPPSAAAAARANLRSSRESLATSSSARSGPASTVEASSRPTSWASSGGGSGTTLGGGSSAAAPVSAATDFYDFSKPTVRRASGWTRVDADDDPDPAQAAAASAGEEGSSSARAMAASSAFVADSLGDRDGLVISAGSGAAGGSATAAAAEEDSDFSLGILQACGLSLSDDFLNRFDSGGDAAGAGGGSGSGGGGLSAAAAALPGSTPSLDRLGGSDLDDADGDDGSGRQPNESLLLALAAGEGEAGRLDLSAFGEEGDDSTLGRRRKVADIVAMMEKQNQLPPEVKDIDAWKTASPEIMRRLSNSPPVTMSSPPKNIPGSPLVRHSSELTYHPDDDPAGGRPSMDRRSSRRRLFTRGGGGSAGGSKQGSNISILSNTSTISNTSTGSQDSLRRTFSLRVRRSKPDVLDGGGAAAAGGGGGGGSKKKGKVKRDKDGFRVPRPVVKRGSSHHEDEPFIRLASEIHVARDDLVDIQTMRNMSNSNPDLQNIGRPPIKELGGGGGHSMA